jgi:hypothetical protein
MKKENLDNYELFYMELPQADYLNDIEIQDEYEHSNDNERRGLSIEQVSQLADDSLLDATKQLGNPSDSDPTLFTTQLDSQESSQ